ncbi:MAG: 5'-nucleotidase [Chlorobi bacterium OLB5]|nr:MAG: 5'-nucleotidase [Chlorobi bacterium OLB5]
MKIFFVFTVVLLLSISPLKAQDTFSITAVDPVTGLVGSAGASCVAGSRILSDLHPNRGVIHTQALYNATNQLVARNLMIAGYTPQQIIDSLILRDANHSQRQYGITDFIGTTVRTAGYTGVNCTNYKNHNLGPTFTVQGNILLGQQILDSMYSRYVNTPGTMAEKLMAALQGAKVPGADTRCLATNRSSISAFIRVARPTDPQNGPYWLDLNVQTVPAPLDPIDSLQILFNQWQMTGISNNQWIYPETFSLEQNYPNPFNPVTNITFDIGTLSFVKLAVYDLTGKEVSVLADYNFHRGRYTINFDASGLASGVYIYRIFAADVLNTSKNIFTDTKKMILLK